MLFKVCEGKYFTFYSIPIHFLFSFSDMPHLEFSSLFLF